MNGLSVFSYRPKFNKFGTEIARTLVHHRLDFKSGILNNDYKSSFWFLKPSKQHE